jgi:hypothetical protein
MGDVARPSRDDDVASVGPIVVVVPAHDADPQREVGRQFVGPAAQHVALVEDRRDHTCESAVGLRCSDHHPSQSRVQR